MKTGILTKVADRPVRVDAAQIAAKRADHLAMFDQVADTRLTSPESRSDREVVRLRSMLRSILAGVESFDEAVGQLRVAQRMTLDTLLVSLDDLDDMPTSPRP